MNDPRVGAIAVGLVALVCCVSPAAADEMEQDLNTIVQRYRATLLERDADADRADKLAGMLNGRGFWDDIDYDDPSRSGWSPEWHINRLRALARAAAVDEPKPAWVDALRRATRHWVEADYISTNWWHNEIGVPMGMIEVLALAGDQLSDEVRDGCLKIVARAELGDQPYTGQNLVWKARVVLLRAAMIGDAKLAQAAIDDILSTLVITTDEGIQPDYSFHQHGPQLMSGAYGLSYCGDMTELITLLDGTALAFPGSRKQLLADYMLEGQQWMMRGAMMSPVAYGRGITREGANRPRQFGPLAPASRRLADALDDEDRAARLRAFMHRQDVRDGTIDPPLIGHRVFWRSDFVAHHRAGWMATLSMVSTRTRRVESINSENLKGVYFNDGFMPLMRTGEEYRGIYPVWDWHKLPGVTSVDAGEITMPRRTPAGDTAFVGGLTDGHVGMAVMHLDHERGDTHAAGRLAWFFLDDRIVALGAALTGRGDGPLITTLEQARLEGQPRASDDGRTVAHNGVTYRVIDGASVKHTAQVQRGTWDAINRSGPDRPIEMPVFTMWIDHDRAPGDASYHYEILPEHGDPARLPPPVKVLHNTAAVQAIVSPDGERLLAVFHEPGELTAEGWPTLAVDTACLVMLRRGGADDAAMRLHVAEPTREAQSVRVMIDGVGHDAAFDGDTTARLDALNRTLTLPVRAQAR